MLLPLPTPDEMAIWDRKTIEEIGIPGLTLMESASREAVDVLIQEYGSVEDAEIYCFAGPGNNGGDAFAMARQLVDLGADVTVFHTRPKKKYRGECRTNLQWAQKLGLTLQHISSADTLALHQPDVIVDGLLGTGFQGHLRQETLELIQNINQIGRRAFVLAVDIPSGLNGFNGTPQPEAIIADATVTFQAPKLGLAMPTASRYAGMVHVRPIGIPQMIQDAHPVGHHLITRDIMVHLPSTDSDMHKGTAGHVLIIGGSPGLTGAPHLAALGALRSGAGLVTVAAPGRLIDAIQGNYPDIMTFALGDSQAWTPDMAHAIIEFVDRFDAIVIGPGMGRDQATVDFLKAFIAQCPPHVILDADGLFGLSQFPDLLETLPDTAILTPHPGEMARLLNSTTTVIQNDRLAAAKTLADRTQATIMLKGAGTLVAHRSDICISPFAEPNLATGGSGDVLAGLLASLKAQGLNTMTAACLGVYWHGLTGRLLRDNYPARGNLASDIANTLPVAIRHFKKENTPC